jgi:hypothetical protein
MSDGAARGNSGTIHDGLTLPFTVRRLEASIGRSCRSGLPSCGLF